MVRPEDQQVAQHLQRVPHDAELAPCDLVPRHGHLSDRNAQRLGEQQQLNVEYPRREVLPWEQRPRRGAREKLESALSIAHVSDAHDAQNGVQAVHE